MGVLPLLLLLGSAACSKSALNTPRTDGALSDVPVGAGGAVPDGPVGVGGGVPDGSGGAGGSGQGGAGDVAGDPPPPTTVRVSTSVLEFGTVCSSEGEVTQTVVTANVVTGASPTINPTTASMSSPIGGSTVTTFILANTGVSPTGDLTAVITPGASDFSVVSNECTGPLAPLTTCRIQVAFKPVVRGGTEKATLTVTDEASGLSSTATLTGTVMLADALAITGPHAFGSVTVGATQTFSFTVKNYGSIATEALDVGVDGADFIIAGQTCKGFSLAPDSQCTFAVTFAPKNEGVKTAPLVVAEAEGDVTVSRIAVMITGTGVSALIDAGTPD